MRIHFEWIKVICVILEIIREYINNELKTTQYDMHELFTQNTAEQLFSVSPMPNISLNQNKYIVLQL